MNRATRMRKFLRIALVCVVLAAAALGLLLAAEKGRQALLDTIATLTATPEFALRMEGLSLGQTWSLSRLTISDASGPWLEAENLNARPVLADLLRGRISLLHAGAARLEITRTPETTDDPHDSRVPTLPPVRIQSMNIGSLHIGPGVMGHEAKLSLRGGLTLDPLTPSAVLHVTRLDRPKDALELDARLSLPEKTLDLRLDLHEEPQGLLHAALGMNGTQGISVHVEGQGPLNTWSGRLTALLSDVARLDGNATLAFGATPNVDLHALITPGPAWNGFTNLPQEEVIVTSQGQWQDSALRISGLALSSASGTVEGNATWDFKTGTLDSTASAQADLSWLLPASITAAPLTACAALRLDQEGIHAQGKIAANDMSVSGLAVSDAEAQFSLFSPADTADWQTRIRLDAQTPALPQGLRSWSANATLGQDSTSFYAKNLHLESDRLGLAGNGTLDDLFRMDARLALRKLPSDQAQGPLWAILDSQIQGQLDLPTSSMNASLDLAAVTIEGLPTELMQLLGHDSRLQARFSLSPQLFHLHEATLLARTKASATGRYDLDHNTFQASLSATLPEIRTDVLSVTPDATLNAKAAGKPEAFALNLSATAKSIHFGELSATGINAKALLADLPARPNATLHAQALAAQEPISLELSVKPDGKILRFADCILRMPETSLRFSGDVDPGTLLTKGVMDFESADLRALGRIASTELSGQATLQAVLDAQQGKQRATLKGQGHAMTISALRIGQAKLEGRLADPGLPDGTDLGIGLRTAGMGNMLADSMDVRLRGMDTGLGFDIDLAHESSATRLSSRGELASDLTRLSLKDLRGTLLGQKLALDAPFDIITSPSGVTWQEAGLSFGPSRLRAQGSLSPEQADIRAELTDFDPALLRPLFPHLPNAEVTASLTVTGDPAQPDAKMEAMARAIRLEGSDRESLGRLNAMADVRLSHNVLQAQASLDAENEIAVTAQVSSPVRINLFTLDFDDNAQVSGKFAGRAKLMLLPHFLHLDDQALDGSCNLDLRVGGTWAEPLFTGTAHVRDARYENYRTGTVLTDLSMDAEAQGATLTTKLHATDGEEGKVEAVGQVDLLTFRHIFDVLFDRFRLLRQDLIQSTAKGGLRLQGNLDRTKLGGSMTLDPTSVRLPSKNPADLAHIDVHEINTTTARQDAPKKTSTFPMDLDLRVAVPARLSVQGRGLDSEWSGNLHVGGTRNQPIITGEMNLLRGTFIFLDRTFDLTKGSLALNGETPPNPILEILGETQILENLIQVRISGPARGFRLTLNSVPALPQDELLAMILFGRSLRQISPLQAVRLAQAAAEMTGIGTGPDFLDSFKSRLGLQEVDVTKDEDDNTAVGVGGYLGGKYYIRTQSSVSGQDRTKVEVQITPKISVQTEVGADSRQGGGMMWKHDY